MPRLKYASEYDARDKEHYDNDIKKWKEGDHSTISSYFFHYAITENEPKEVLDVMKLKLKEKFLIQKLYHVFYIGYDEHFVSNMKFVDGKPIIIKEAKGDRNHKHFLAILYEMSLHKPIEIHIKDNSVKLVRYEVIVDKGMRIKREKLKMTIDDFFDFCCDNIGIMRLTHNIDDIYDPTSFL